MIKNTRLPTLQDLSKYKRLIAGIVSSFVLYLACFNSVEFQHRGIAWNRFTGKLYLQMPGYYVTEPWVSVSQIDIRPQRVCLQSSSLRTTTCKLVRFDPIFYREFVAVEGHKYYWFANRVSYNSGYREEYRGFKDLLRGYAFHSARSHYSFIVEESDY